MNALHVGNLVAAVGAAAARFAHLNAVPHVGDQLSLSSPFRQINGVVDCFVGDGILRVVGSQGAQFAGNLLW